MRILTFALLLMILTCCSSRKLPRFIPVDFEYPDDSIGEGKTFVYHDSVHNQNTFLQLRYIRKGSDTLLSYFHYTDTAKLDSQLLRHGQLVKTFRQLSTLNPRVYKGEDILDVIIDDGTKLGRKKTSWTYNNDTLKAVFTFESQFIKDTSILWKDQLLPCLVIQSNATLEMSSKLYSGLNRSSKGLIYYYYAKNIGVIRNTLASKDSKNIDHYWIWTLASIENGINSKMRANPAP
jgi:hypothetical protein